MNLQNTKFNRFLKMINEVSFPVVITKEELVEYIDYLKLVSEESGENSFANVMLANDIDALSNELDRWNREGISSCIMRGEEIKYIKQNKFYMFIVKQLDKLKI